MANLDRQAVIRRTETAWIDARQWVPDSPRKVIGLAPSRTGKLHPVECRFSGGAWRFLTPKDKIRKRPVRVWMDIPWWDSHEHTQQTEAATKPAGAKARAECETEAQADRRTHGRDAREEAGLTKAEADFADLATPRAAPVPGGAIDA